MGLLLDHTVQGHWVACWKKWLAFLMIWIYPEILWEMSLDDSDGSSFRFKSDPLIRSHTSPRERIKDLILIRLVESLAMEFLITSEILMSSLQACIK